MLNIIAPSVKKTIAVVLCSSVLAAGIMPISTADAAHKRKKAYKHNHQVHKHNKRRNNNGDLIAAGIVGLAIGAIIAGSERDRRHRTTQYNSYPDPSYTGSVNSGYNGGYGNDYYEGYTGDGYYDGGPVSRQPLTNYNGAPSGYVDSGPRVVTYEDTVSLEPWSQGWYDYCGQKYRSFNPQRGTFRGFDGQDHFCVPN